MLQSFCYLGFFSDKLLHKINTCCCKCFTAERYQQKYGKYYNSNHFLFYFICESDQPPSQRNCLIRGTQTRHSNHGRPTLYTHAYSYKTITQVGDKLTLLYQKYFTENIANSCNIINPIGNVLMCIAYIAVCDVFRSKC